ncbi:MAG: FAD-binding protein [Anaerolineales bacterium]|nr:FAD-binding protein [Anaerolineales bacterium]
MLKDDALRSLEALFDKHQLTTDPVELITYEVDAGLNRGTPEGVVFPKSSEDVIRLAAWAAKQRIPLVARASGTGLSGGAVPSHGGIIISFSRMNHILNINEANRLAVVEPGVINLTLDTTVKKRGFYFPPDPASQRASAIGGNIAENAGGPHCFKYGVTSNYVKGLELVLADGKIVCTGGSACDYPEYDFTGLICGSEGTLAIVTSATLRLIRNPTGFKTLIATFNSVEEAGQAVSAIIAQGLVPATLEMMDRNIVGIIEDFAHAGLPTDADALLLAEVDGYQESLDAQVEEIERVLKRLGVRHLRICQTTEERERIWFARKSAFGAIARISPAYFQVDGTVPRSRLAETLSDINSVCADLGLRVGYVFHAGDGNLHPIIPFDPVDQEMEQRVHQAGDEIMAICVSKGGAITGEHGVGIEKRKYMPLMYSADELTAMYEIKEIFDPDGILNPGKIFPEDFHPDVAKVGERSVTPLSSIFTPQDEDEAADGLRAAQSLGQPVFLGKPAESISLPGDATILSTSAFRSIKKLSPEDLYVVVESGMNLAELQAEVATKGLWTPIASPWKTEATIGGVVSAALNSPFQMRYGSIRDQVLGMNVILPDGRHLRLGRPVIKNVAGYDLTKLFVGAHGTLGLITNVMLKLTALPRVRRSLIVSVPDLMTGLKLGDAIHHISLVASAILLCPGSLAPELPSSPYHLVFTVEGYEQDIEAELRAARSIADGIEVDDFTGVSLWERSLNSTESRLQIGILPGKLSEFIRQHVSTLGETFVVDIANGTIYTAPAPLNRTLGLRETALSLDGYAVVVNGPKDMGIDPWGYTPDTLPLMRQLKARWDPKGILNPGVFLV